jgi:hypothetical protein
VKKLNIRYELTFTCDEWLIDRIDHEWDYALDEIEGTETEEEIFEIALAYALVDSYNVSYNEREAIMTQSHEIYEWWKENK